MNLNANQPPPLASLPKKDPIDLVGCAVESFVEALVAFIWGKIVLDMVGGIVGNMIPSLPPGMSGAPSPHHHHHGNFEGNWLSSHQFWIVFAVFFILNLRARMVGPLLGDTGKETRAHRIVRHLREEGFSLLFSNAISAMIAAWVAAWATNFSWPQLCLHWLFSAVAPTLNQWAEWIFGQSRVGAVEDWCNWWSGNQFKFSFWLFYLAAICDDLGIPNFKTLTRFFWRRFRARVSTPLPPSGQQSV